jgi:MFS family permease
VVANLHQWLHDDAVAARANPADTRTILLVQALRAAGYGFTAVLLGTLLAARHYSPLRTGLLLATLVAGTAAASLVVGAVADRVGRRRSYAAVYVGIAVAGAIVAMGGGFWVLLLVAVTGTLSTDVVDNGPATTLEQVMLAGPPAGPSGARRYGWYNATGALAGAFGALAINVAGVSGGAAGGDHSELFVVLVPVGLAGAALAVLLSPAVEAGAPGVPAGRTRLGPSQGAVRRLACLFAVDAGGGGLVTASFLTYFFVQRYHASVAALGALFFAVSLVQALSVLLAPRLADRFGLVPTMVGTHLPSNLLLAAVAFAPTFPVAAGLLLARTTLSQMDVPTRQALVMAVVTPAERTPAAAVTNAARYTVRPAGPLLGGALLQLALGAPLVVAGAVKAGYDLALWGWARHLPIAPTGPPSAGPVPTGYVDLPDPRAQQRPSRNAPAVREASP